MFKRTGYVIEHPGKAASRLRHARAGFTLVELLVALVLLDIGLLALIAVAASITRSAHVSGIEASALSIASARLERAASLACGGGNSGVARANPATTEWFADMPAPNETRVISDSVAVVTSRGIRTIVLRTGARC